MIVEYEVFWFMGIILVASFLFMIIKAKFSNNKGVKQVYDCVDGRFCVKGKRSRFFVKKNNRFEFLIIDGRIVAHKDNRINKEFIYYERGIK